MNLTKRQLTRRSALLLLAGVGATLLGCKGEEKASSGTKATTLRLAFFPNVTHAAALVGTGKGFFQEAVGESLTLEERSFTAGPAEIEALFAGEVDLGYIGPGPALNGYLKSNGDALKIIAGASSGGAALVAKTDSGIATLKDLDGKRVAIPQTGGTQDISLRHFLGTVNLKPKEKNGTVSVLSIAPADTVTSFERGDIDAAWVPEPWVTRLVREAGCKIVADERSLWTGGKFATTVVIARTEFLKANPDAVRAFLEGHRKAVAFVNDSPADAQKVIAERIQKLTGKAIPEAILKEALTRTEITDDPLTESVLTFADWSRDLGYQRVGREKLTDLFDTTLQKGKA